MPTLTLRFKSGTAAPVIIHATRAQSSNKLLEAATVDVPSAGPWNLRVSIGEGSSQGALAAAQDAAPPAVESGFSWGYAIALAVGAGLIALYLVLRAKPLRRGASLPHAP